MRDYPIMFGKKSAICGKAINTATWHKSAKRNGNIPLNMVPMGTSGATPLMTKTFRPTGGVSSPISVALTTSIPNQIGSKPSFTINGKKIGTVSKIIAMVSITQPRTMNVNKTRTRIAYLLTGRLPTYPARSKGILVTVRKYPRSMAPNIIANTMTDVLIEVERLSLKAFKDNLFLKMAKRNAPKAPIPAASVGVKAPI